jgi:hypothetical protein
MGIEDLGLPALTPLLLGVVGFTVWIVQILKRHPWARRVPGWVWLGLSIIIPVGIVFAFGLDWIQALIHTVMPSASIQLDGMGTLGTGIATAIAGNGSYALLKKAGLTKEQPMTAMTDSMTAMTAPLSTETPSLPVSDTKDVPQDNPPVGELPMVKAVLLTEWQTVNPPTALMLTKDGVQQVFRLDWSD